MSSPSLASLLAGLAVGAAWNAVNLWCLTRGLRAWLSAAAATPGGPGAPRPSRRRAVAWLLVKFPLLYGIAFAILRARLVSLVGFGLGFLLVLVLAIARFALAAQRLTLSQSHGR